MNNTFARKQEISASSGNPLAQPLADTISNGGMSDMTGNSQFGEGRSYVTGKPSAMASFQDREVDVSGDPGHD